MTLNKNIQVLFHRTQLHEAELLQTDLESIPIQFEKVQVNDQSSWKDQIDDNKTLLWLISDNYLKSTTAMKGALEELQRRSKRKKSLFVIVTPGQYPNSEGEGTREVPTRFDRMGEVIQYMNYWQTEYLDMRKWKRNLPDEDQDTFEEKLTGVKSVSSSIGDFLRILQDAPQAELLPLRKEKYRSFLDFLGFPKETVPQVRAEDANRELRELIEASSEEILRENEKKQEEPPVSLEDIPGMDLLSRASNALNEIEEDLDIQVPGSEEEEIPNEAENIPPADAESDKGEEELSEEDLFPQAEPESESPDTAEEEVDNADNEEEEEVPAWESRLEDATALLLDGDPNDGISQLEALVNEYPAAPELRFNLAVAVLEHHQNTDLSRQLLEDVVNQEEDHIAALYILGELAILQDKPETARDYFERVFNLDDEYPEVCHRLGMIYARHFQDEPGLAEFYLKKATKQDPELAEAHYQLGLLYQERLFRPKKAQKHFKKTLEYFPEHPFANYDLALLYHQADKLKKARKYYLEAIAINPELRTSENDQAFRIVKEQEAEAQQPETFAEIPSPFQEDAPVVLITGATSGIGRATARQFAREGYRLILTGRRADRLYDLKQELQESGSEEQFKLFPFDVRDPEAVDNMIHELEGKWGEIDILVNNAGLAMGLAPIHEGEIRHWETMIDTNIKGLLYMTRAVAPGMVKRGRGMIINVCSTAGKETYPNGNVYSATKHAVDALTKSFRLDLYKHGIRVGQVSPGHVEETEFALVRFEGDKKKAKIYEDFVPLRAADVADAIYYMATRPPHVNIQDILLMGTQQAGSNFIDRSGREE